MKKKYVLAAVTALAMGMAACSLEPKEQAAAPKVTIEPKAVEEKYPGTETVTAGTTETEVVKTETPETEAVKTETPETKAVTDDGKEDSAAKEMIEGTATGEEQGEPEAGAEQVSYVGKYMDYDTSEPNLEIQENDDGTYGIQIGVYRLAYLEDGIGRITEEGMEFSATAPNGTEITGIITLDGEIATVTFVGEEWKIYSTVNEYQYYKVYED